jgi:signal transduction histidine kinase
MSLSALLVASRVTLVSLSSLLIAIATGVTAIRGVLLLVSTILRLLATVRALCLRILSLAVAITVATILYFSSSVGTIILAVTAGLSLSLVTAESTAKDGASLAEEAAETTLLLLLLTGRRGHLVAGVLLNHARDGAGSTLKDSVGRSTSNLVLEGLRATAVQLSHL